MARESESPEPEPVDEAATEEKYWTELLRPLFVGRRVVVTGGPVAGLVSRARLAHELGSERPFILGTEGVGTGELPASNGAEWLALDPPETTSFMEAIRAGQAVLADLPSKARAALDRYDPDHSAIVLASFLNDLPEVAGRKCLNFRKPEWVALEDKTVIDGLWDRAAVAHEPSEIVAATREALHRAVDRLDHGHGTVWVGDARDGIHGGAEGARWIRASDDVDEAVEFLGAHCDRARVMPFLEGIPCSIHGLVFADYVAALRPVEMVTLRRPRGNQLLYAGVASYWDPSPQDRNYMRDLARRVGTTLRETVAYRGAFTVDGVMTEHGFRPTELNPRFGVGLNALTRGLPHVPTQLLCDVVGAGIRLDYRPQQLEELILKQGDEKRGGGTWRAVTTHAMPIENRAVAKGRDGWRWASDDEPADGWVEAGPGPIGGFIRLTLNASRTPKGPSVAPTACDFYRFADEQLGTELGPLEPARSVR
jgi:hypothetical protein